MIAGQGEGPLAPEPLPLGVVLAGENASALDWVGAHLLGYDPVKIPLLRLAFQDFRWPIAEFRPEAIELVSDSNSLIRTDDLRDMAKRQDVKLPAGWRDARA